MINHEKNENIEYSFVMAPFYLIDDDHLLKSQLSNLNQQTENCFEVVIPDPHYNKRGWLKDFSKCLKYNLKHFPHVINNKVPKTFDYSIINDGVLLSESEKIITFQDWRFCDYKLIETLKKLKNYEFIGFLWQILYKDSDGRSKAHNISTIDIAEKQANDIYNYCLFPDMLYEIYFTNTFGNKSWGHYCINKDIWLDVNGIDEVVTNTRHYADLDINTRLNNLFNSRNKNIDIPMIKNTMVRIMHNKGKFLGGSNIQIDIEPNQSHYKCCFNSNSTEWGPVSQMNDKKFVYYVMDKINKNEFTKLYETTYSENFKKSNKDESLDDENSTIGFICNNCKVIGETPHWYKKSPSSRIRSLINIGLGEYRIGRNLMEINERIKNKSFEEKLKILKTSKN